ncbi:hypothetical protein K435DRAFT_690853, partial [Dendrothele bispora CBS 962.96]
MQHGLASGLESSDGTFRWLWSRKLSVLGSDNPTVENSAIFQAVIGGVERSLHQIFIGGQGLSLVEYLDLESLAETCHKLNRIMFVFTAES